LTEQLVRHLAGITIYAVVYGYVMLYLGFAALQYRILRVRPSKQALELFVSNLRFPVSTLYTYFFTRHARSLVDQLYKAAQAPTRTRLSILLTTILGLLVHVLYLYVFLVDMLLATTVATKVIDTLFLGVMFFCLRRTLRFGQQLKDREISSPV
jgi:hypothetical protein